MASSSKDGLDPKKPVKKPRLLDIASGAHHVSQSALESILVAIRDLGEPGAISKSTYRRERQKIAATQTPFGPIIHDINIMDENGEPITLTIQHSMAMLHALSEASESFRTFWNDLLIKCNNKINLVLYNDEVDMGKEIAARHAKKLK